MSSRHKHSGYFAILTMLWNVGGILFIGFTFWLVSWEKFAELLRKDAIHFGLYVALASMTFLLFILWAFSTHRELGIFGDYLSETNAPPLGVQPYAAVCLITIFLAVLINLSDSIISYSCLMAVFSLVDVWAQGLVRARIGEPIQSLLKEPKGSRSHRVGVELRNYYLVKPHFQRQATLMLLFWVAFAVALTAHYEESPHLRNLAYLIVILSIVGGELVIWIWRKRLYSSFNKHEKEWGAPPHSEF